MTYENKKECMCYCHTVFHYCDQNPPCCDEQNPLVKKTPLPPPDTTEGNWSKEFDNKFSVKSVVCRGGFKEVYMSRKSPQERIKSFISSLLSSKREALREKLREKIVTAIGNPPPCLSILIEGKTIEESQQYIEGAEDMRKKVRSDILQAIKEE